MNIDEKEELKKQIREAEETFMKGLDLWPLQNKTEYWSDVLVRRLSALDIPLAVVDSIHTEVEKSVNKQTREAIEEAWSAGAIDATVDDWYPTAGQRKCPERIEIATLFKKYNCKSKEDAE